MQIDVDVTYMYTNFGGRGLSGFGDKFSSQFCKSYNDITMDGVFKQSVSLMWRCSSLLTQYKKNYQ